MTYAGRSLSLGPDEKITGVNEACKNHLVNNFGQRGLVALGYSDHGKEEEIGVKAREINLQFKKKQVRVYNETNEQRKLSRLGYLSPSKKIKEYAVELGVELLEPYTLKDEEKAAIAKSTVENELLKQRLLVQQNEMDEMRKMLKTLMESKMEGKDEQPKRLSGAQRTLRGEG